MSSVGLALLLAHVFFGVVRGKEPEIESTCPPTIVDCACTEKDGNFYTIQTNITTISISDEDTGFDRCIADGDPLALCEERKCIIIPNDNFAILFRNGKKMSPSNYLQEDYLEFENKTSGSMSNNTDEKAGPEASEDMTSSFYPIEFTYPRMIHGEESHQLVKRDSDDGFDDFLPPPNSDFGSVKYERNDHDSNSGFGEGNYRKNDSSLSEHSLDSDFSNEEYGKRKPGSRLAPYSRLRDVKYGKSDSTFLRASDLGKKKYREKDSDSLRHPMYPKFRAETHRLNNDSILPRIPDFGDDNYEKNLNEDHVRNTSMFRDSNYQQSMGSQQEELDNTESEDNRAFRNIYSSQNANTNWGGNYGYACRVPQLRNSEVTCWKWPNWQTCKQTCIYGHGLASSRGTLRSTTFTCRNSENQWRPHRMTDCQPYLNCKVRLRSPGDLKCVEPTDRPAYCDISCEQYDNHSSQRVRVTCDENMGGMRLPFCATLDNSFMNHIRSPSS